MHQNNVTAIFFERHHWAIFHLVQWPSWAIFHLVQWPSWAIVTNTFFESISTIFDIADNPLLLLDPRTLIMPNL